MAGHIADGLNVLVIDGSGERVVLSGGDEVPSWAADQVGDHALDGDKKPAAKRGAAADKSE